MAENEILLDADLGEFDSTVNSDGDMTWDSGSIDGHAGRMRCLIDDTTAIYGIEALTSPGNEYRYRLYLAGDGLSMANGNTVRFMYVPDDNSAIHFLQFRNNTGTLQVSAIFYNDGFASSNQTNVNLGSATQLEVHCKRAATNVSSDGFCKVYADASFGSPIINITGVDNYDVWVSSNGNPGSFRLGAILSSSGITGSCYFTRVKFNNTGAEIGAHDSATPPTVTDIANQTGVFGTQKSIACTIADTGNDIARCDVSTNGTSLITLTASGAASITNNGTTAPYVTGTHTDVVATLGNNISISGVRAGTELSHAETITVLATDSLSATGNDTFTMTWSVPTGVGTQTLHLTGTHAQLNTALATVEVTGTVEEVIECLMYSVTSTPLTDTDTFNITFSELSVGIAPSSVLFTLRRRRRR